MARITVVDDYPEFLDLVSAILDGLEGHDVAGLDGSEATIQDVVATNPDLLIVDLRAADRESMDGKGMILERARQELPHVPVIVCSGDVESLDERADELAQLGTLTLHKPFAVEHLVAVVNEALDGTGTQPGTGRARAPQGELDTSRP